MTRDFFELQERFAERLRRANTLDLERPRVQSPLTRWLRMSLGVAFGFLLSHERRHLWQARQVRAAPGFPSA